MGRCYQQARGEALRTPRGCWTHGNIREGLSQEVMLKLRSARQKKLASLRGETMMRGFLFQEGHMQRVYNQGREKQGQETENSPILPSWTEHKGGTIILFPVSMRQMHHRGRDLQCCRPSRATQTDPRRLVQDLRQEGAWGTGRIGKTEGGREDTQTPCPSLPFQSVLGTQPEMKLAAHPAKSLLTPAPRLRDTTLHLYVSSSV